MKSELPIGTALRRLNAALKEDPGLHYGALPMALVWMAAARMVVTGNVPGVTHVRGLEEQRGWEAVFNTELVEDGFLRRSFLLGMETRTRVHAVRVLHELVQEMGDAPWDTLPFLWDQGTNELGVHSSLVELMLDYVGDAKGELWIPFDPHGHLCIHALRRGWSVNAAQVGGAQYDRMRLMLAIEFGQPNHPRVNTVTERSTEGRPTTRAAFALVCPPFGNPELGPRVLQWASDATRYSERYVRTDAWVVNELMERVTEKAVFLVSPSLLFTQGQEQQLRERLLRGIPGGPELQSVLALPGGGINGLSLASAVLTVTPRKPNAKMLMVDLGSSKRSQVNIGELLTTYRNVALGHSNDAKHARVISLDDVPRTDLCLAPARFIKDSVDVGPNPAQLGEVCTIVRPPALVRDMQGETAFEIGISSLTTWAPVGPNTERTVRVRRRSSMTPLAPGDVVVSVKGTIGKAGIVSNLDTETVVLSQSCIALRLHPASREEFSPEFLLMYLRSPSGLAQLEYLQTGTSVQQVNPTTLQQSFMLPRLSPAEQQQVEDDYQKICDLEAQIKKIGLEIDFLSKSRWSLGFPPAG
jgi:hypothetical protein